MALRTNSRRDRALINTMSGLFTQILAMILSFVVRTVFVRHLSIDYLGVNGLYSNILTVLSLSELGLNNVMLFSLYKPIAENNRQKICQLITFYKKLYNLVAIGVFALGLLLVPVLDIIIQSELTQRDLTVYYLFFLMNSVCSYFVVYKSIFLNANQEVYIVKSFNFIANTLKSILQIVVIVCFKNYILYLFMQTGCILLENIFLSRITTKKYPFLQEKAQLPKAEQVALYKNMFSAFLYRIGTTLVTNTDNILISVLVSTAAVGYYSNYCMIVAAVTSMLSIVIHALTPSIGNLRAENNPEKSLGMFYVLQLTFHFMGAYCGICLFLLMNQFIPVWLGPGFTMDWLTVFAITLNFYLSYFTMPIWTFREVCGLFDRVKFLMMLTAVLNLIFSVLFGMKLGVAGILLATSLSKICTVFWYEPHILFESMGTTAKGYWLRQIKYAALTLICGLACYYADSFFTGSYIILVIKALIFFLICLALFSLANYKSKEFIYLKNYVVYLFKKLKHA